MINTTTSFYYKKNEDPITVSVRNFSPSLKFQKQFGRHKVEINLGAGDVFLIATLASGILAALGVTLSPLELAIILFTAVILYVVLDKDPPTEQQDLDRSQVVANKILKGSSNE